MGAMEGTIGEVECERRGRASRGPSPAREKKWRSLPRRRAERRGRGNGRKKQGVGASPAAGGRWDCEADFRGLPSLGPPVGGSAGVDFFSLSPYFKCKDPSRDSAGVAFTGTC
jgi:hypothetical protein